MNKHASEHVLCFRRTGRMEMIMNQHYFCGFVGIDLIPESFVIRKRMEFRQRSHAEQDPGYLQLIPYVVIRDINGKVFCYQRTKISGEERLKGKWSIGVGGHINPVDSPALSATEAKVKVHQYELNRLSIEAASVRELQEEVIVNSNDDNYHARLKTIGWLSDDTDHVGSVHFGIVRILQLEEGETITIKDPALGDAGFYSPVALLDQIKDGERTFEKWSAYVLAFLAYASVERLMNISGSGYRRHITRFDKESIRDHGSTDSIETIEARKSE